MICPKCGLNIPLDREESYFDGHLLQLIGWRILAVLVTVFSLGICYPWALCMLLSWEVKHTVINGRRLRFDGTATQLFGNWIKWWVLSLVTIGIYALWLPIKVKQWTTKHTQVVDERAPAAVDAEPDPVRAEQQSLPAAPRSSAPARPVVSEAQDMGKAGVVVWILIALTVICFVAEIVAMIAGLSMPDSALGMMATPLVVWGCIGGVVLFGVIAWALSARM